MKDFIYQNPAKIYFGKDQLQYLKEEILKYGNRILIVYGKESIKKIGLYDKVKELLKDLEIYEFSGIEPNPRHTTANKGARLAKDNKVDLILAIGGGSVIDCAKAIATAAQLEENDIWPIIKEGIKVERALPIIAILTNAATGSEMNGASVITNIETNEKKSFISNVNIPKVAFLNPEYSYSLSSYQTASGAFDIFSHILDNYYLAASDTFDITLNMQEAVMKTVIKWAPIALKEPRNYEARANLMWASSIALNGFLDGGSKHKNTCHAIGHELSAYYDLTHGHSLAIITPRWLEYILDDDNASAIYRLGIKVFDLKDNLDPTIGAKETIKALSDFAFKTLNLKANLSDLNIDNKYFKEMATSACRGSSIKGVKELYPSDVEKILMTCL